jgi:uncharacterized membrane protein
VRDELARIAAGLPVAALWPLTVPYLAASRLRAGLATAASALYILAPQIPSASSFFLLLLATGVPLALWTPDSRRTETANTPWKDRLAACGPVLAPLLVGLVAVALVDFEQARKALEGVVESDRIALAGTGLMATVFIGGSLVAWILKPFTRTLGESETETKLRGLAYAGRYIGWFERAVLFAFVIGGEPEAAAVALAAKSFARFPTLSEHHRGFAEYFLIGSLASLTVAVAVAAATRAALGIGPF